MYKFKIIILIFICIFIISCQITEKDKFIFKYSEIDSICDFNGNPIDSSISYFPIELFLDTISKNNFDSICEDFIFKTLIDSFIIKDNSYKEYSYTLFKMKEPILTNHYLGKDIYRFSVLNRNQPFIFSIEKNIDRLKIVFKKLNRIVKYPFIVNYEFKNYKKNKIDSLNNTNYFLEENINFKISNNYWDTLLLLIDSANFWQKKENLYVNKFLNDANYMIVEGHSKNGYQIKNIYFPSVNEDFKKTDNYYYYYEIYKFLKRVIEFYNKK